MNCQWVPLVWSFRQVVHAAICRRTSSMLPMRPHKHCSVSTLNSLSAHTQFLCTQKNTTTNCHAPAYKQTRNVAKFHGRTPARTACTTLPWCVPQKNNTEIVQNDRHDFCIHKIVHHQPFDFLRPIPLRSMCPNRDATPVFKRSHKHKHTCRAVAFVFVIDSLRMACMTVTCRHRRDHPVCMPKQLNRLLIHRNDHFPKPSGGEPHRVAMIGAS